jgi:hypothetical protein
MKLRRHNQGPNPLWPVDLVGADGEVRELPRRCLDGDPTRCLRGVDQRARPSLPAIRAISSTG